MSYAKLSRKSPCFSRVNIQKGIRNYGNWQRLADSHQCTWETRLKFKIVPPCYIQSRIVMTVHFQFSTFSLQHSAKFWNSPFFLGERFCLCLLSNSLSLSPHQATKTAPKGGKKSMLCKVTGSRPIISVLRKLEQEDKNVKATPWLEIFV